MKLLYVSVILFLNIIFVLSKSVKKPKINNKEILNKISSKVFFEAISDEILNNDDISLDKRQGEIPMPGLGNCENYWYNMYCIPMELIYRTTCVPYCELNIGKYKNMDECYEDFCHDHRECHLDCFQ
ncbi:hypothetical protein BCR32DRAFT_275243 [Anaeromyces robustus]|uniref:Kazal-like domain-containing protein n=1 Tax=Anaeromyces robustus TaxID=1754192 RepID=A0A1Y1XLK5_9FUNG|nr:hypothetical protein BCR32DRAFT_275243 [Anaeromyces robustus]|eukprot:ORX86601.1 hypothetical protein BCR32DRAFT_275243 [Anaeromyces robustus]